jgi:hypothetical protein
MKLEFIKHVVIFHIWLSIYAYHYYLQVNKMDEKQGL